MPSESAVRGGLVICWGIVRTLGGGREALFGGGGGGGIINVPTVLISY